MGDERKRRRLPTASVGDQTMKTKTTVMTMKIVIEPNRMDTERKYRDIVDQIQLGRFVSIFINLLTIVQLLLVVILPDLLPPLLKIWLVTVSGGGIVGILIALLLSRDDIKTTNFFILISIFISGLLSGISIVAIIVKEKN
jgi:hypothetical protein